MKEIEIDSVDHFIKIIKETNEESIYGNNLWYRAESSKHSKTHLTPGLFREYVIGPRPVVSFSKKEESLKISFKNEAHTYLTKLNLNNNVLGVLFLLQHYGGETRLLDWTSNALISLFFAVENEESQHDSIIWILDPYYLNGLTSGLRMGLENPERFLYSATEDSNIVSGYLDSSFMERKDSFCEFPIAILPFYIDDRMKSQNSCFTLFGHNRNGLLDHPNLNLFMKKRLTIPKEHFRFLKRELFRIGISYDSVYPGLEGISKKINYSFKECFL